MYIYASSEIYKNIGMREISSITECVFVHRDADYGIKHLLCQNTHTHCVSNVQRYDAHLRYNCTVAGFVANSYARGKIKDLLGF